MKMKKINRSLVAFMFLICFSILAFSGTIISVNAQEVDYTAENKAKDFLVSIYNTKDLTYENMETLYSVELYDENNEVIAQASLFERDSQIDYAIYNYITNSIDEYGFDCPTALGNFPINIKTYYAGIFNYYNEVDGVMLNNVSGEIVDEDCLRSIIETFKEKMYDRLDLSGGQANLKVDMPA